MSELTQILKKLNAPINLASEARSMTWLAQESKEEDILFYRLPNEDVKSIKALKERVKGASYKWLFINTETDLGIRDSSACGEDFYKLRTLFADHFFPIQNKLIIAVTGTNGKTTTVDLIRQLLVGKKLGVLTIGTLGVYLNNKKCDDFSLTSPDYIDLRKVLYGFREDYSVCALEASSHAINQKRLYGLKFSALGWTSFSQDHLDYHKTMESYFEAKLALSESGRDFIISHRSKDLIKRLGPKAHIAKDLNFDGAPDFLKSAFNKINLEVAVGCLKQIGVDVAENEYVSLVPPPGRFNIIEVKDRMFIIDFAHTPDALLNVGSELKRSYGEREVVTIFGCGGDRDRSKRKLMGEAASSFSDVVIVTSDNPRNEDPEQIINDVVIGVSAPCVPIIDRTEAIKYAFNQHKGAVILVAGKGHEPYIDIMGKKLPYSDEKAIRELK